MTQKVNGVNITDKISLHCGEKFDYTGKKKNSIWLWFRLGIALWSYLYDWFEDDGSLNNIEKTFRINFLPPVVLSIVCCRIDQIFV